MEKGEKISNNLGEAVSTSSGNYIPEVMDVNLLPEDLITWKKVPNTDHIRGFFDTVPHTEEQLNKIGIKTKLSQRLTIK